MARPKDAALAARNTKIVSDFVDRGQRIKDLAREHGMTERQVYTILGAAGVRAKDRKVKAVQPSFVTRRPISQRHAQVGFDISTARHKLGIHSVTEMAKRAKLTGSRMKDIEDGIHDWTWMEIERVCAVINLRAEELVKLRDNFRTGP